MKRIDLKILAFFFLVACSPKSKENTSEVTEKEVPVEEVVQLTGNFGDEITEDGVLSPVDLLAKLEGDRKSTRLNSSHPSRSRMPSSA